jgi:protein TonB
MSYAQRKEISGNRTLAIIMVVVLQFALGYAIVTGLAYNVIKKSIQDLKTFDVEQQPPPPEKPPPPPKDMPNVPPPPTMPPVMVQTLAPPTPIIQTVSPTPPIIQPVAPSPPPAPPPPRKVQSAQSAKGDLRTLFSPDDYPASAQAAGAEGTARAEISIGTDGRVTGCTITQSSGNSALDAATCNIIRRRAKFTPARDTNGNPVTDSLPTPPIRWVLQD